MTTVFVTARVPWPPRGGDSVHAWATASGLAAQGFDVVVRSAGGPPGVRLVPPRRGGTVRAARQADVLLVRVDGVVGPERVSLLSRLRLPRAAVVWEVNAPAEEVLARGSDVAEAARLQRRRRRLARLADAAVAVSEEMAEYARSRLGIRDVTVVENGAEWPPQPLEATSPLAGLSGFTALWMGTAHNPWQAVDTAAAAGALLAADPMTRVAVVPATPPMRPVGPGPGVLVLPPADRATAAAHLRAAGCALCLYHDTPWAPEGFYMSPVKLFEAWAAGVPVVATALGPLRRLVDHEVTGLLVGDDPAEVAGAVRRLRDDASLRGRLAEAGRRSVAERYSWDRAAREVAQVLQRVSQDRRRG